jgi:alkylhydroperoxidase/carboxymuconolactone decarboxylase family protein YurZ
MEIDKDHELERVTALRGFRYGSHDLLAEIDLPALKALNDRMEGNYLKPSLIDRKTKELLILVACLSMGDRVSHVELHVHGAHKAGASAEEILEAINLVSYWTGAIRKGNAVEAWREYFRPDIETTDRIVELR